MKFKTISAIGLVLAGMSFSVAAAEITHVDTLHPGDSIYVSNDDGASWYQGNFINHNILPDCPVEVVDDTAGGVYKTFNCPDEFGTIQNVWYNVDADFDVPPTLVTGRDPQREPVSQQEVYGLLTRFNNILTTQDLASALGSIQGLYQDRNRLLEVLEVTREQVKQ